MKQEELEQKLLKYELQPFCGPKIEEDTNVKLEWINPNEHGFCRTLNITTELGYSFNILWYHNLLTICLDNGVELWADDIAINASYPSNHAKLWLELTFKGNNTGVHIPLK
jgi:hypothetical protein